MRRFGVEEFFDLNVFCYGLEGSERLVVRAGLTRSTLQRVMASCRCVSSALMALNTVTASRDVRPAVPFEVNNLTRVL